MKSAQCNKPKSFQLIETEIRSPGNNEVVIKIEGCGVCGSNLPVWEGRPWFNYPLDPGTPGHEGWGRIVETGKMVRNFSKNDRVAILSSNAFAEYETVSADHIVKLPSLIDSIPFPGEPLGCAINVFKRSNIQAGQKVAVIGAGFLGNLIIQLAVKKEADVSAVSKRKFSLEMAKKYGVRECFELKKKEKTVSEMISCSNKDGFDCVIEATGYQESLDLAGEIIKNRGRLIIAGYHQDGMRTINVQQWNWKGIDVINAHEREHSLYLQGMREAIDAIISQEIDILPLFTHVFAIDNINIAFELLKNRPEGFIKALVTL
jgi:threonine dehydrogenase-like Zn-dependent dehydrogenase